MRERFDEDYIRKELKRVGKNLNESIKVYLIGGGAMALQGMKEATKDIDVVVTNRREFKLLERALIERGYEEIKEVGEYEELGAQKILERDSGCRFDIFNTKVVDKLVFLEAMKKRSKDIEMERNLKVKLTSPEDIFLFKSIAGRTTDIEDMNTLVQVGLNFETIEEEIKRQSKLIGQELFITYIGEALNKLEKRYGITLPLLDLLEEKIISLYDQLEILREVEEGDKIEEFRKRVKISEERFEKALEELERKENLVIEGDKVKKKKTSKI